MKHITISWQDPLADELINKAIPDEKISKYNLDILEQVVKTRPNLVSKFLRGDGQNGKR